MKKKHLKKLVKHWQRLLLALMMKKIKMTNDEDQDQDPKQEEGEPLQEQMVDG